MKGELFISLVNLPIQHTLTDTTPLAPHELSKPPRHLIQPPPRDNHTGDGIYEADQQREKAAPLFTDEQQDRLDVILEEDARDEERAFGERGRLAGCCVLVREDEVAGGAVRVGRGRRQGAESCVDGAGALGVDRRYDGEEVLVFVVVGFGRRDGFVEGVEDGWVVRAEGKFVDYVREVES